MSSINIKAILTSAVSPSLHHLTSLPSIPPLHLFFPLLFFCRTVTLAFLSLLPPFPPPSSFSPLLSERSRIALSQQEAQPPARTAHLRTFHLTRLGLWCSVLLCYKPCFFFFGFCFWRPTFSALNVNLFHRTPLPPLPPSLSSLPCFHFCFFN